MIRTAEGKIIRMADKLCWIESDLLRWLLKHNKIPIDCRAGYLTPLVTDERNFVV